MKSLLKITYYDLLKPKLVWPMQMVRVTAIYNTMARTIRKATDEEKLRLKEEFLSIAVEFDNKFREILVNQVIYDDWFFSKVDQLKAVEFHWQDARKNNRTHIELGLAQKFLNLMVKDWWCINSEAENVDVSVIYAPFDNIVWNEVWKAGYGRFDSLKAGGYSIHLSKEDYLAYQELLMNPELKEKLGIPVKLNRLETEQWIWSKGERFE
jgi:hypothetical protein